MKKMKEMEVEIPVTPMLDMAFQLLTFFILTYHPAPAEGQFAMNLLPAQPATRMDTPPSTEASSNDLPAGLRTLPTTLSAGPDGNIVRITLGENTMADLAQLDKDLSAIVKDPTLPFDQTVIKVDPSLKYSELIKVVDVFSKYMNKISFEELAPGGEGIIP